MVEAIPHCIPEVVQAIVNNIGLKQSQDYHTNSPRVRTANDFSSSFQQGDVRPTPLSASYNMPEEVKRKVHGGKFVHLYKLLPGFTDQDEGQPYVPAPLEDGTLEFTVKASNRDKKLARKQLSAADFCRAFLKYKFIICHEFPNCHNELDAYLAYILSLYMRYQGNAYWLYHVQFTKLAAIMWERGIRIKWSQIDPEVLHTVISAQQRSFCDHLSQCMTPKLVLFQYLANIMVTPAVQVQLGPSAPGPLSGGLNMLTQGHITRASKYVIMLIIVYANGIRIATIYMYAAIARILTTHSRLVWLLETKFDYFLRGI